MRGSLHSLLNVIICYSFIFPFMPYFCVCILEKYFSVPHHTRSYASQTLEGQTPDDFLKNYYQY